MKLVTTAQMRELEQIAVNEGATWEGLMERAGAGVAWVALDMLAVRGGSRALVLVGPGNNGGDGLVVARFLHDAGVPVSLYIWRRRGAEADTNWVRCRQRTIPEMLAEEDAESKQLRLLLAQSDLVVDALLGMGQMRPVDGLLATLLTTVQATLATVVRPPLVLAVDVPTGIRSDGGTMCGMAIRADQTVATGLCKHGLWLYPGRCYTGTIRVADIGIPAQHVEKLMSETITAERVRALLPTRPVESHKGTFGKVMVLAGSLRYPGAALLAAEAAVRTGAGVVTLACGRSLYPLLAARVPEVTMLPLPEADWGTLGEEAAVELAKNLEGYRALLIGPGLGREEATGKMLRRLLGLPASKKRSTVGFRPVSGAEASPAEERVQLPSLVIDADGLNLLAGLDQWWERFGDTKAVLTPHPGEMQRLLGVEELEADRVRVATEAAARWGLTVLLKGAGTVVASADGQSAVDSLGGNAALATAGTGDVLAGIVAALLAQGLVPFDAALVGVYLHSAAGARVRDELGNAGTAASDLLPRLPLVMKALR